MKPNYGSTNLTEIHRDVQLRLKRGKNPAQLEAAVRHVLRYGKLGKQSRRRLKEALNGL